MPALHQLTVQAWRLTVQTIDDLPWYPADRGLLQDHRRMLVSRTDQNLQPGNGPAAQQPDEALRSVRQILHQLEIRFREIGEKHEIADAATTAFGRSLPCSLDLTVARDVAFTSDEDLELVTLSFVWQGREAHVANVGAPLVNRVGDVPSGYRLPVPHGRRTGKGTLGTTMP